MITSKYFFQGVIAIALTFLASTGSIAQTLVSIGPKAGPSFSELRGQDAGNVTMRRGFAGGLFLCISPLQFLSLQPEFLLQQKGAVNQNETSGTKMDIKLGYLNIPLLLKMRIPIFRTIFPHIYGGPQFAYAFKSSASYADGSPLDSQVAFQDMDFGGVMGAGMDIEVKHLFVTIDFRYGLGALNLVKDDALKLRNRDKAILFGVGYKI